MLSRILVRFMQIFSIAIHAFGLGILMGHTHQSTDKGIFRVEEPRETASFLRSLRGRHFPFFSLIKPQCKKQDRPRKLMARRMGIKCLAGSCPTTSSGPCVAGLCLRFGKTSKAVNIKVYYMTSKYVCGCVCVCPGP